MALPHICENNVVDLAHSYPVRQRDKQMAFNDTGIVLLT